MKPSVRLFALAAVLLSFFPSCEREKDAPAAGEGVQEGRVFTCVIAAPTKVSVDESGKTVWEPGDEILVHAGADGTASQVVTLTQSHISPDGKKASFTLSGLEPYHTEGTVSTYYALYPAYAAADEAQYDKSGFSFTNDLLMAACNVGDTFVFYNLCGILSYRVSGDFNRVVFSGNGGESVGAGYYQACVRDAGQGPEADYLSAPNYSCFFELEDSVSADGVTLNRLCFPAGADFKQGFTFRFYKDDVLMGEASTDTPVRIDPGRILSLGDISGRLSAEEEPVDLSADGSANCYIVTEPGTYKFPAVKGNSSLSPGAVTDAGILWESWNNGESVTPGSVVAQVSYQEDGWIVFRTPAVLHPGNAVIAATGSAGNILWSWHIWIPETPIAQHTYSLASAPLMDRNLGALCVAPSGSDARSFGLLYQWGRKDPFPGMQSLSSTKAMTVAGTATTFVNGTIGLEGAVTHPAGFYMVDNGDWNVTSNDDLWGASSGGKTLYDPCPPGYKVPGFSEAPTLFSTLTSLGSWSSRSGYFQVGSPAATFPYAGYIDDYYSSQYCRVGERALIWSADGSGLKAYGLDVRSDVSPITATRKTTPKARGGSVRCIASDASAPDPGQEEDEETIRRRRLGRTPIVAVYFTEYTPSAEFPTLEDVRCFTHINVGHARFVNKTTGDGGLEIKSPGPTYMKKMAAYKKDYPELKLLLFIGGWGKNADGFSMMARDPAKRALFCSECLRLCNEYNFDGVDIDWEYPTYSADKGKDGYAGTGADPSDTENFTILVKELRETLGPDRLISYAASSSGEYMDHVAALQYVDYINVMTYSMGDPPYHNSPLYRSSLTRKRSCAESIEIFRKKGVPYDRMNFGLAFYGHADGTVYPSSMPYYKIVSALTTGKVDGKSVEGYNYRWWDDDGKNVYLGDASGKIYASYEDEESLGYRIAFVKEKGMLGAFGWEYREDAKDGTLRKFVYRSFYPGQ